MEQNPTRKKIAMWLYVRKDLRKASCIHATCELEKKNVKNLGFTNQISIVPNGIDIAKFTKELPEKVKNPKKILFLSRIHQKKGIEFLIDAWDNLDTSYRKGWIVEVVGNGELNYIHSLQEKIKSLKLENEIIIKEPVFGKEKLNIFREASLFVLPTYSENFGIVVAEALACYTPVITTVGTPWEELNTKNCGWCIPIGSEALLETFKKALVVGDKNLQNMGINGRLLIEETYSLDAVSQGIFKMYLELKK